MKPPDRPRPRLRTTPVRFLILAYFLIFSGARAFSCDFYDSPPVIHDWLFRINGLELGLIEYDDRGFPTATGQPYTILVLGSQDTLFRHSAPTLLAGASVGLAVFLGACIGLVITKRPTR